MKLFNENEDQMAHRWPFVYLHGEAELLNEQIGTEKGFDSAPDLFVSDTKMPQSPGEYPITLYGQAGVAVIAKQQFLKGRVALLSDPKGLAHARSPQDWR